MPHPMLLDLLLLPRSLLCASLPPACCRDTAHGILRPSQFTGAGARFIQGNPHSVADQVAVPVFAATDAPVACFDAADEAFQIIFCLWKRGHIIAMENI